MTILPELPIIQSYLSCEEINDFLTRKLHLPLQDSSFTPNLQFLQDFCRQCAYNIPYSNLHYMAVPPEERDHWRTVRVEIERVRQHGLSGKGGMCFDNNVFLSWILKDLGYQVAYILARVFVSSVTHVLLVVRINEVDYIVDPSAGARPLGPNPVPMDFDTVSPVYKNSIWDMKFYKKLEDGVEIITGALHWNEKTAFKMKPVWVEESWAQFLAFERRYYNLEQVIEVLSRPLHDVVTAALSKPTLYWTPNGRLRACLGRTFIWEDEKEMKHEKNCNDMEELRSGIMEMFDGVGWDKDYIDKGLKHCDFDWQKD